MFTSTKAPIDHLTRHWAERSRHQMRRKFSTWHPVISVRGSVGAEHRGRRPCERTSRPGKQEQADLISQDGQVVHLTATRIWVNILKEHRCHLEVKNRHFQLDFPLPGSFPPGELFCERLGLYAGGESPEGRNINWPGRWVNCFMRL